jgi:UDP-glucuronate decarboxylase
MKSIVTGGAGFLGSNLVVKLLELGHDVIVIDNFKTGKLKNLSNIESKNLQIIELNVIEEINIEADFVFNFACPASPVHYQSDPVDTMKTNILGMINVLEHARKYNSVVIQSSTSEVYGDPNQTPQDEEYWGNVNPIGIRACYDEGKRAAETLCFDYARQFNVDVRVARIFNTYGPNMAKNDGRVVSNFIVQALMNEPITIYGNGNQTRSFCYVDDLISGVILLSATKITGPVNVGNPTERTVRSLAEKIIQLTGSSSKISHLDLPEDDPKIRKPNISKAKKLLGWNPEIDIDVGLEKTITYFKTLI